MHFALQKSYISSYHIVHVAEVPGDIEISHLNDGRTIAKMLHDLGYDKVLCLSGSGVIKRTGDHDGHPAEPVGPDHVLHCQFAVGIVVDGCRTNRLVKHCLLYTSDAA